MTETDLKREYLKAFGKVLKDLRQSHTQKSLRLFAYEADIPCATLSRLENGTRIPNLITLKKVAFELNISVSELLNTVESRIPDNIKNFEL